MPVLKIGSSDANTNGEVTHWQQWFGRYAGSYAPAVDGYIGTPDVAAIREMQARLGIVVDGEFGDRMAARVGYKWKNTGAVPVVETRRPIWIYTAPGSGANWDQGPSFQLGNRCRDVLKLNHQPISFQKGGYLGLMGGDPKFSYNEVIFDQYLSLKWLLDHNPDVQRAMEARRHDPRSRVDVELWFSGYSQSADGMEDAVVKLFGDDGPYRLIRDRINGLVQFGNPSTRHTGIARKERPEWLYALVRNINYDNDFYSNAPDAIRPAFYKVIVEAEMELPFFVHVLQIAIPVILDWAGKMIPIFSPFLGNFGPMVTMVLPMIQGLQGLGGNPMLGQLMGQAQAGIGKDQHVHDELVKMLTLTGLIQNVGGLIALVGALPGLQAHGGYEFDPVQMNRAYDVIAAFRR